MRACIGAAVLIAACACARLADAQDYAGYSGQPGPPRPRVGFQLALRTGLAVPLGNVDGLPGGEMTNFVSPQVPLFVEIGGKVTPHFFVGGFLGLAFGGPAGDLRNTCEVSNSTCVAAGARFGAEVQYHIMPEATANPWIGYGIGYESVAVAFSEGSRTGTISYNGFEFAHLMGGVDFRLSRVFGLGPFVNFSVGTYSRTHYELSGDTTLEGDVRDTATHEWLTAGVRVVFFP